ncbi:hypothetical protein BDM02DRAFT_156265 [Thelephora ganbajun]|uniref:Uncharacterized protein n=1 Tax=Thelephora ganbajun TaxID=370292 RepID=A0ACB6ZXN3_THEGA|nr:hypothetical protein BDM02DRAFT_156265 [Thelephora ganbajun]
MVHSLHVHGPGHHPRVQISVEHVRPWRSVIELVYYAFQAGQDERGRSVGNGLQELQASVKHIQKSDGGNAGSTFMKWTQGLGPSVMADMRTLNLLVPKGTVGLLHHHEAIKHSRHGLEREAVSKVEPISDPPRWGTDSFDVAMGSLAPLTTCLVIRKWTTRSADRPNSTQSH